jgi:glutaconyl-CoA/methylmalonyl-CoA decarboxylase subunit gamma
MKNLRVTVDGKVYNVSVEILGDPVAPAAVSSPAVSAPVSVAAPAPAAAPAPVVVAPPAPAAPKPAGGGVGEVCSPLAGKVVSIDVTVGQTVAEGQQVATIEAMKMNTFVYAPKGGQVTAVVAVAGAGVDEGAPLVVIS